MWCFLFLAGLHYKNVHYSFFGCFSLIMWLLLFQLNILSSMYKVVAVSLTSLFSCIDNLSLRQKYPDKIYFAESYIHQPWSGTFTNFNYIVCLCNCLTNFTSFLQQSALKRETFFHCQILNFHLTLSDYGSLVGGRLARQGECPCLESPPRLRQRSWSC